MPANVPETAPKRFVIPTADDLATVRTSDLLAMQVALALASEGGGSKDDSVLYLRAVAAEIDRRIPSRDTRVGRRCRLLPRVIGYGIAAVGRIVSAETGGALHYRSDAWTSEHQDLRIKPGDIAEWL